MKELLHALAREDQDVIDRHVDRLVDNGELPWITGLLLGSMWGAIVAAHDGDLDAAESTVHHYLEVNAS